MKDLGARVSAWLYAERQRKVRKYEARRAWLLAFKAGVKFVTTGDGYYDEPRTVAQADTDEAKAALRLANEAKATYRKAASHAGALRAGLSRSFPTIEPAPNMEVQRAYEELLATECEAA